MGRIRTTQAKLPGMSRGRQKKLIEVREEDVMKWIASGLRMRGYEVLETTHRYKRQTCPKCFWNFWPKGGYGASPGVPDLLVSHDSWPRAMWCGMEVKGSSTPLSDEQKALHNRQRIYVVRSIETALAIVQSINAEIADGGVEDDG